MSRAKQVRFSPGATSLAAEDVQAALEEMDARVVVIEQGPLEITLAAVSVVEVGQTLSDIAFTAGYGTRDPLTELTLLELVAPAGDTIPGGETLTVPFGAATSFDYVADAGGADTFTVTSVNGFKDFTLNAQDVYGLSDSALKRIYWSPAVIWGAADVPGAYDGAFIDILRAQNYQLKTARNGNYTATAGATNKLFFAIPASYGAATFFVGGFEGGFSLVAEDILVTNPYGEDILYDLYESDQLNLGLTTFTVT